MARSAKVLLQVAVKGDEDVDSLDRSLEGVEESLEDVSAKARRTSGSLSDVGGSDDIARMRATGQAAESLADDVDDVGRSSRASQSDVRVLLDEFGAAGNIIRSLDSATQGLLVTMVGGVATVGAGLGLAGGATLLASKFGPQGLQQELKGVQAAAKNTAGEFSETFAPVIQNDVIPTVARLLGIVESADQGLADFSASTFDFLRRLKSIRDSGPAGRFLFGGPLAAIPGDQPFLPDGFGLSALLSAIPEEGQDVNTTAERIEQVTGTVQDKLSQLNNRTEIRGLFGIGRERQLQQRVSVLEELRTKLVNVAAAVDPGEAPVKWRQLDRLIGSIQDNLQGARRELNFITSGAAEILRNIEPGTPVETAAGPPSPSRPPGGFELSGSARELGRVGQAAGNAGDDIEQNVNRELQRGVNLASQIGTTLIRSAREGGVEFEQVFGTILSAVGGTLSAIPGVGQIAGPILGGAGRLISAFDRGGVVDTPLQVVGESGPELAALPQGTRVSTARETERMLAGAQSVNVNIETELRRLPNGDLGVAVRESQRRKARHE